MATIPNHVYGTTSARPLRSGIEISSLASIFLMLGAYAAVVAPLAQVPLGDFLPVAARFMLLAIAFAGAVWTSVRVAETLCGRETPWSRERLTKFAGACILTGVTLPVFGLFKQMVLSGRGFPLDPLFARADLALFGTDAWRLTHAVFGSLDATRFLDGVYCSWLSLMFGFPMLVAATVHAPILRMRLIASWLLSWIVVGTLGAWLLASAGPVYYDVFQAGPPRFADLLSRLQQLDAEGVASGSGFNVPAFQQALLHAQASGRFAPAGGISAMPSMHVAMAVLFAIGAGHASRLLAGLAWAYALCIWIGSVHFGWHYALDGIVSAVLMAAIWWGTGALPLHRRADDAERRYEI